MNRSTVMRGLWQTSHMLTLWIALLVGPLLAHDKQPVDLMLVLATDVSSSITSGSEHSEFAIQKRGIVKALRDPEVGHLLETCNTLGVAITYIEWADTAFGTQDATKQVLKWQVVTSAAELSAFARRVEEIQDRSLAGGTDIANALEYSAKLMDDAPLEARRRIVSVSGDGPQSVSVSNADDFTEPDQVRRVELARDKVVDLGVEIDALVIMTDNDSNATPLDEYFRRHVVGGPGAHVVAIRSFEDYAEGLRANLLRALDSCAM